MPAITYSNRGGMIGGIEQIEANHPETINRIFIDYKEGLKMEDTYKVCLNLNIETVM
jgi:succinyl-CoA synthetase beta subunit